MGPMHALVELFIPIAHGAGIVSGCSRGTLHDGL